jgi:hypothetical protein
VTGGIITVDLPGFTKDGEDYTNSAYDPKGDNLEIAIDAGASTINSVAY